MHLRSSRPLLSLIIGLACVESALSQSALVPLRRDWIEEGPSGAEAHCAFSWGQPFAGGPMNLSQSPLGLVWSIESDGTWIADAIGISANGTRLAAKYGPVTSRTVLLSGHDANPPAPIWEDVAVTYNHFRHVRMAAEGEAFFSLHQDQYSITPALSQAVVHRYGLADPAPQWTYVSPITLGSQSASSLEISRDAATVALAVTAFAAGTTRLTRLGRDDGAILLDVTLPTPGGFKAFALAGDGSTAILSSSLKLLFVDMSTGAIAHEEFLFGSPQYGALAISGDGQFAAFGTLGHVRVFRRNDQGGYSVAFHHGLSPANYVRRAAFSLDGSTLVLGTHQVGDVLTAGIVALDTATEQVLMETQLLGGGGLQNYVSDISVSASGHRFAIGLWGDEEGLVPEVLVYRRDSDQPILAQHLSGSVMSVRLTEQGNHIAVANKGTHANVAGGGGAFSFLEVGRVDMDVIGVPRVGNTIWIRQRLRADTPGRILRSEALAPVPGVAPELGSGLLYLDASSLTLLPEVVAVEADGGALTPFAIPDDPTLVGQTFYLQGLDLGERRLSRVWIPLTILP